MLYERLGYRAPFVFALCLGAFLVPAAPSHKLTPFLAVFVDLVLRLLIIEKREAIKWIAAGHEIVGFEAPGYSSSTAPAKLAPVEETAGSPPAALLAAEEKEMEKEKKPTVWGGLLKMVTEGRPLTLFALSLLDGIILGGLLDTGVGSFELREISCADAIFLPPADGALGSVRVQPRLAGSWTGVHRRCRSWILCTFSSISPRKLPLN